MISRIEKEVDKHRKQNKDKWIAIDECKDQLVEYEEEAETLRQKIEDGVAKFTQSYAEQKLVLTTIEGVGKEASASPAPADLLVGIERMQNTYTGFFSGAESDRLPQEVRDKRQEFEDAFLQMQTIATKLAVQQTISKAIAEQKPPAATWATGVGNSAGSTSAAVPGGTRTAPVAGGEGSQARSPT